MVKLKCHTDFTIVYRGRRKEGLQLPLNVLISHLLSLKPYTVFPGRKISSQNLRPSTGLLGSHKAVNHT
jgi:hypothetical protein